MDVDCETETLSERHFALLTTQIVNNSDAKLEIKNGACNTGVYDRDVCYYHEMTRLFYNALLQARGIASTMLIDSQSSQRGSQRHLHARQKWKLLSSLTAVS